jgi:hypothetical protein
MSLGNYLEDKLLDHIFGKTVWVPPILYVGLGFGATDQNPNELPSEFNYERVQTNSSLWSTSTASKIINTDDIKFNEAIGGDWGYVNCFLIFDYKTLGNFLMYGTLKEPWDIKEFEERRFLGGELEVTLD